MNKYIVESKLKAKEIFYTKADEDSIDYENMLVGLEKETGLSLVHRGDKKAVNGFVTTVSDNGQLHIIVHEYLEDQPEKGNSPEVKQKKAKVDKEKLEKVVTDSKKLKYNGIDESKNSKTTEKA